MHQVQAVPCSLCSALTPISTDHFSFVFFFSQLNATACLFVFMKSVLAKIFELTGIELIILFKNLNIYVHLQWSILFIQI